MVNIRGKFRTQLVITRQPRLLRASVLRFILPLTKAKDLRAKGIAYEAATLVDLSCQDSQTDHRLKPLD